MRHRLPAGVLAGLGLLFMIRTSQAATGDLASVLSASVAGREPIFTLLKDLSVANNFDADATTVAQAVATSGAPSSSAIAKLLAGVTRISKKGDQITLERPSPITIPFVSGGVTKGWLEFDEQATFTLKTDGSLTTLGDPSGLSVGETADSLHGLRSLTYDSGPSPKVTFTAGSFIFSGTRTFNLDEGLPPPTPPAPPPPPKGDAITAITPTSAPTAGILAKVGDP
jgi:hypothetical protein